jgi:SAM-dependent methyltransferase
MPIWNRLSRPFRELRWHRAAWSSEKDRTFHEDRFASLRHDAFSPSYPGNLTIRRFADLAVERMGGVRQVLDLGCGVGEITCELARRRPDVHFTGVDHSDAGVARARETARRLQLSNITFEVGNLESFSPAQAVDLITLFDSFHHVLNPAGLLARLQPGCPRFFLVEPAGIWTGQWNRALDLDWVAATVLDVADRLEYELGLEQPTASAGAGREHDHGEATERRYTLDDLQRFFAGYRLDVRGTIAGLEQYGPRPLHTSGLRDRIGRLVYDAVVAVEETMREHGLDLGAKHWAIYAERADLPARQAFRVPRPPALRAPASTPQYGVEFLHVEGPSEVRRGERFDVQVRFRNTGWRAWDSAAESPIFLSYHWLDSVGRTLVADGLRSPLPRAVATGDEVDGLLRVEAPDQAGRATLALDLVHEGVTWFSGQGIPARRHRVRVR